MALKVTVKVGNIVNLSDARYCAGMGVDLLGFPSNLPVETYRDIRGWVTGPQVVLELTPEATDVPNLLDSFVPDLVMASPKQSGLLLRSMPVIWRGRVEEIIALPDTALKGAGYFQIVGVEVADLPALHRLRSIAPVLVEWPGDLLWEQLNEAGFGLALQGSAEERPGLKDFDSLSLILEKLEVNEE